MKLNRAFGLALTLTCLVTVPLLFAGGDSEKDKKTHTKETTTTTKTKTTTTTTTSHTNSTGDTSGHSTHHSSTDTSGSATADSGHSHGSTSGGDVVHSHTTTTTDSSVHSHDSSTTGDSTHSHSTHQTSSTSSSHTSNSHERYTNRDLHVVDHEHLREVLRVHPGHDERVHAFERSHEERARFERHVAAIHFIPAHRVVLSRVRIVPTTYYYRRNVFYDTYRWGAPVYVYRMYPRYGLWDTVFLAFALDHIADEQYALMLYHHQHDAEIQQWLEDSDRLAEENDDLRAKLESMKLEMARLQDSGVQVDASYVPEDAQDVALSPEVIDQLTKKNE